MTIEPGPLGAYLTAAEATAADAVALEEAGYGAIWLAASPPADLLAAERLLDATSRILVGASVLNVWRADVAEVAESYHRIAGRHAGRLLLGIGAGHRELDAGYTSPLAKIAGYLDALTAVGVPADRVLLAALGPKMLRLAADRAAGTLTLQVTPEHTRRARQVLGPAKLVVPGHGALLDTDAGRARETGRAALRPMLGVAGYAGNLRRIGFTDEDLTDPFSDRLVDALVLHGDAAAIAAGIRAELAAGADQVGVHAIGEDPIGVLRAIADELPAGPARRPVPAAGAPAPAPGTGSAG
ncbi:TIGR03620 family F420-dependent LLM class oxidoreductase [Amycolatopsis sp. cmx-4-61]|uniref:TIGR03620 family F420-dependent LLM class oxidoreductase n=1 Tax=Amycolatopsis sp. cmx-4-61 TaxID=2790937 RepID=UPI0039793F52